MKILSENVSRNILQVLTESEDMSRGFVKEYPLDLNKNAEDIVSEIVDPLFNKFLKIVNKYNFVANTTSSCSWKHASYESLKKDIIRKINKYKKLSSKTLQNRLKKYDMKEPTIEIDAYIRPDPEYGNGEFRIRFSPYFSSISDTIDPYIEYGNKEQIEEFARAIKIEKQKAKYKKETMNDGSKYYFILENDYLQRVKLDAKYYDDDWNTWTCYSAKTVEEAKKFRKYESAENFLDKRIDDYSGMERIDGITENALIVSSNQLISGKVKTKTDISALFGKGKNNIKDVENNTDIEDDTDVEDDITYTLVAEDGKEFSYTTEYQDPESREDYTEMPIWDQAVQYSNQKGFKKLEANEGDRTFVWTKNEDGEFEYNDNESI